MYVYVHVYIAYTYICTDYGYKQTIILAIMRQTLHTSGKQTI